MRLKTRLERLEAQRHPADGFSIPVDALPDHLREAVIGASTTGRLDVSVLATEALRELVAIESSALQT